MSSCDYEIRSTLGAGYRQGVCAEEVLATTAERIVDVWVTHWTPLPNRCAATPTP